FETSFDIITSEIFSGEKTPAKVEGIKEIIDDCDKFKLINSPVVKEHLTDKKKFRRYIKDRITEERFWNKYY
ncbi:MAG: hypothetical protein PF590_04025, partial [Candidatus Delongbacteria bacterium]|nr:hypothetical protein [Candidatus Delongbacteria bacterium]